MVICKSIYDDPETKYLNKYKVDKCTMFKVFVKIFEKKDTIMMIKVQCALAGILLVRVEIYKVAHPPRRSVFVVVTAVMGKERSKASEFPGVVRSRPSA